MTNSRQLGLLSATALVVASMVGTGVFTTSGFLLADLKSPIRVLLIWLGGGVLACLGALSYGALARRLPESGGEYLFLSRTLHPAAGYVAGWVSLLVGFSAPLAFAAFAFGEYSKPWWPGCPPKLSGAILILALSAIHAAHVKRGAWVQNVTVLLKVALIMVFIGLAWTRLSIPSPGSWPPVPIPSFAVALMWVSFSYSGWNAAVYIGGEIREPERNLPRALLLGTALVTVLYLAINTVFVYAAPISQLVGKPEVGRIAAGALGGPGWANAVGSLVALVLVSSVSAQIMAGPRVYAKMAADGYLPRWLIMGAGPPRAAIAFQASLALAMLWSTSFEWLLTYMGFTLGLSTAATVLGLIVLRRREGASLPVPGWPWVPGLFLLGVSTTTVLSLVRKPQATLAGLATMALGWVAWRCSTKGDSALLIGVTWGLPDGVITSRMKLISLTGPLATALTMAALLTSIRIRAAETVAGQAAAQQTLGTTPAQGVATEPGKKPDVIYVPTPQAIVDKMLELAQVKPGDVVYDLGCGDGRIVVTAAKKYHVKAVGFDIDPKRVKEAIDNVNSNKVEELVTIKQADIFTLDLRPASVVTLYLLPDLNVRLMPQLEKLKPGSRIVSHEFDMRGAKPVQVERFSIPSEQEPEQDSGEHTVYKWIVPWETEAAKP